ncbi:MAG: exodeoxyribonuclease VII small subunit [Sedimentisphaeraceae bacterium JB056]
MNEKLSEIELDKLNFEDTITRLEEIVRGIETGQTPLEESLTKFETGMKLIAHCREILGRCEEKLETIAASSKTDESK